MADADEVASPGVADEVVLDLSDGDTGGEAGADAEEVAATAAEPREGRLERARSWANGSPQRLALAVGMAVVVVLAGLTGWLGFRAYQAEQSERLQQLLVEAGRQGAINLTTISYEHADADVQRILDSATDQFYDDFTKRAQPFADFVKQTQSKSAGTVTEAGLESVGGNEGRVLVVMTIKSSNRGADQPLRSWRLRVTVKKVGDEAKVSRVEPIQ